MPLELTQTAEGDTGWAAADILRFQEIEDFVNDLEIDVVDHPHQPVRITDPVTFDDLDVTNPSDLWTLLDTRYYTEDEVDEIIAGAIFSFWLSDTPDGVIGGYNRMFDTDTGEVKSQIGPVTIDADEKIIKAFVTAIADPDFTVLSEGVYSLDIHATSTAGANVKAAKLRWKLYSRTHPAGVETLLITSEDSIALTTVETHETIHGTLPAETNLDITDRLVLKVYGVREGDEPANPDIRIFMEGDTATRVEVRTNIAAFDSRYLRLGGQNAMEDDLDMGTHAITNVGLVDGIDVPALKTDVDEFPDELKLLTQAEIQQLENIGATTISAAQWTWFGSTANLRLLTEPELLQIGNIGATTISATQWGYLGAQTGRVGMTDRGDPAAADFSHVTLTTDAAWHDLDLSAILPAGAKTALLRVFINSPIVGSGMFIRTKGNTQFWNTIRPAMSVANIPFAIDGIVAVDGDRKAEYWADNIAWTAIYIVVAGWWFE